MTTVTTTNTGDLLAAELLESIVDKHVRITKNKAEMLALIRSFEELGLAQFAGARTTAQVLQRRLGMSESSAYEYVHVAMRLGMYPLLEAEFMEGRLSYSVVRLLLKYITEDNEAELVQLALDLGYSELEIALQRYGGGGVGEEEPERYLRLGIADNGDVKFWGRLNPIDGAALMAALKLGEIAFYGLDQLTPGEGGQLTEEEIDAAIEEVASDQSNTTDARPARQTASGFGLPIGRALLSSLMGMVHMVRAHPVSPLQVPAAHVNIVMTEDGRAYLPNNLGVPSSAIANVAANAALRYNIVDAEGLIIKTGRQFRLATPSQVNALVVMWGMQCAAPGCRHSRFLEMHHIDEWANGGMTDVGNLLPLCSACHSLVTDGYIRIEKDGSDLHFIYRDGTRYVSHNYSLPRRDDSAVTLAEYEALVDEELAAAQRTPRSNSATTRWQ